MLFSKLLTCSFVLILGVVSICSEGQGASHEHGGIVMGVSNVSCDDAQWRLDVDWDSSTDFEYSCQPAETTIDVIKTTPTLSCLHAEEIPRPIHKCMTDRIEYDDQPPRGGPHRPLWPIYGEYLFVPPQRWVHSLEHGAVVFLYHPCADQREITKLKAVVKSCLRRHIITPYRSLPLDQPLALLTYGCKFTMSTVNINAVKDFIQENAMNPSRAKEYKVWKDGQYKYGLLEEALVPSGSDITDSVVCPSTDAAEKDVTSNESIISAILSSM